MVSQSHCVNFWARQRLHDKIQDLIDTAHNSERLPKAAASKIYGIANFLEQGIFGRVGYGCLMAIKARQDEDVTCLTPAILQCFEVIEAVVKVNFPVSCFQGLRFLAASGQNSHILKSLKPGKDDAFLLDQSVADATQGLCTPPMDRAQFLKEIQNQPHRLIPRCVITQSSMLTQVGRATSPQMPNHEWHDPAYQLYSGLLFGLPLAVTFFNRLSRLLESLCRRLGGVLISFYFDDATITDPKSAKGKGPMGRQ